MKRITPVYKANPEGFGPVLKIKKFLSDVEYKELLALKKSEEVSK